MSRNYQNILQISQSESSDRIDLAYRISQERYLRLTSKGPLRYYRHVLLTDADEAYRALSSQSIQDRVELTESACRLDQQLQNHTSPTTLNRPVSILSRRVNALRTGITRKPPVKSSIKKPFTVGRFVELEDKKAVSSRWSETISQKPQRIKSVRLTYADMKETWGDPALVEKYSKKELEDLFCKEVIFRLEGDMVRYSSRQELLAMATAWQIPLFQANLLIAQIVESVRTHQLHLPGRKEKELYRAQGSKKDHLSMLVMLTFCVLMFILFDFLVLMVLRNG